MSWLEVSLTVSGELAEAVADVLARFAPYGVAVESTTFRPFDEDVETTGSVVSAGPVIVRAYLPQDDQLEDKRSRLTDALWHLRQLAAHSGLSIPEPEFHTVAEADWAEKWKEHYRPIRVGRRLIVVPAWLNPELAPDDVPLRLDPGMAFGTGTHPTTQLCLAAIEDYLRPGDSVLDLGTGSGILAIAAAKLQTFHGASVQTLHGASVQTLHATSLPGPILALDIDPEAVRVASENVEANGVAASVQVRLGSLSNALEFGNWELAIANILSSVIIKLLSEGLAQTVAPGGALILSGVLEAQAGEVESAVREAGMEVKERRQMGEWVGIVAGRK